MYRFFLALINFRVKSYSHHFQQICFSTQQVDKCDFPYPHNLAPDFDNTTSGTNNTPNLKESMDPLDETTEETSDDQVAMDTTMKGKMKKNPILGNLTAMANEGERASVTVFEDNSALYGKTQ